MHLNFVYDYIYKFGCATCSADQFYLTCDCLDNTYVLHSNNGFFINTSKHI